MKKLVEDRVLNWIVGTACVIKVLVTAQKFCNQLLSCKNSNGFFYIHITHFYWLPFSYPFFSQWILKFRQAPAHSEKSHCVIVIWQSDFQHSVFPVCSLHTEISPASLNVLMLWRTVDGALCKVFAFRRETKFQSTVFFSMQSSIAEFFKRLLHSKTYFQS